jgi:hypothetical protein
MTENLVLEILYSPYEYSTFQQSKGRILERNPDKSPDKGLFPLAIHSHLYSFVLRFIFLKTHATSYVFLQIQATSYIFLLTHVTSYVFLQYTVKDKGGKADRKPYKLPYGLRNSYLNDIVCSCNRLLGYIPTSTPTPRNLRGGR